MMGRRLCVRYETQMAAKQGINVGSYDSLSMYICLTRGLSNHVTCYVPVLLEGKRFINYSGITNIHPNKISNL